MSIDVAYITILFSFCLFVIVTAFLLLGAYRCTNSNACKCNYVYINIYAYKSCIYLCIAAILFICGNASFSSSWCT